MIFAYFYNVLISTRKQIPLQKTQKQMIDQFDWDIFSCFGEAHRQAEHGVLKLE